MGPNRTPEHRGHTLAHGRQRNHVADQRADRYRARPAGSAAAGELTSEQERERLRSTEEALDQCWDLLRQRRAKREFGESPEERGGPPGVRGGGVPAVIRGGNDLSSSGQQARRFSVRFAQVGSNATASEGASCVSRGSPRMTASLTASLRVRPGQPQTIAELHGHPFGVDPAGVRLTGNRYPLAEVRLLAPVLPSKVMAVGKNYAEHVREMGGELPAEPVLFLKPSTSVTGPGDRIAYPVEANRPGGLRGRARRDHRPALPGGAARSARTTSSSATPAPTT